MPAASYEGVNWGQCCDGVVPGRRRHLSRSRAIAAYVAKRLGGVSFDRMGRYFGRDGSTLVRDVAQLEKQMETFSALRTLIAKLRATPAF